MAVELQIRSARLAEIISLAVQDRLSRACFPKLEGVYVDRADIVAGSVAQTESGGQLSVSVGVDVHWVLAGAVQAAPNAAPAAGPGSPARITVALELGVAGSVITMTPQEPDLGPLAGALGAAGAQAKDAIKDALGHGEQTDLGPLFTQFKLPAPAQSRIEVVGQTVAIRFDPAVAAVEHLVGDQDWGLFFDAAAMQGLMLARIPDSLKQSVPEQFTATWQPLGEVPAVKLSVSGTREEPAISGVLTVTVDFTVDFDCRFALVPELPNSLRTTVLWVAHAYIAPGIGIAEEKAEEKIEKKIHPEAFHPSSIGDHTFTIDSPVPQQSFLGCRLFLDVVAAAPAGMTVGGRVVLPVIHLPGPVQLEVGSFAPPTRIQLCSELQQIGGELPSKTLTPALVTCYGYLSLTDAGRFCGFDWPDAAPSLGSYVRGPAEGTVATSSGPLEFFVGVPGSVGNGITGAVRFVVRTARGVRLIDLGELPKVTVDASGQVTNARDWYIPNCMYISVEQGVEEGVNWADAGINWGGAEGLDLTSDHRWERSWSDILGRRGLDVQMVHVSGLEAGEQLRFRSATHAIDVTADAAGHAVLPAMFTLEGEQQPATLRRVGGGGLRDLVSTETATFQARASLPAGEVNTLAVQDAGEVLVSRQLADGVAVNDLTDGDVSQQVAQPPGQVVVAAAATGAPAVVPELSSFAARLPDVVAVTPIPGFAGAPVAVATLAAGEKLLLDVGIDGPRVAGSFRGPIGQMDVEQGWAMAADAGRVSVYALTRSPRVRPRGPR